MTAVVAGLPPARASGPTPLPEGVFPIGVWLQQPKHAARYRELGINLYVGLWKGPTPGQLALLKQAGMPVICEQNEVALADRNGDVIAGWLQQDEPDNAQPVVGGAGLARLGWGSPVSPAEMQERYRGLRQRDPSRPVMLNLGKGVAWDAWKGRGNRTGHPEDYPEYVKAADIVSFDIYPAAETDPALAGRLELVADGTRRLVDWAGPDRSVWAAIGASRVKNPQARVDPEEIRAQVWMSIIRGARGVLYFAHQFAPVFRESAWLDDPALSAAIARINAQVQGLARVILSRETRAVASWALSGADGAPVPADALALTTRRFGCDRYVFAVSLSPRPLSARIEFRSPGEAGPLEVLYEDRVVELADGAFSDGFGPYAVRLYRFAPQAGCPGLPRR